MNTITDPSTNPASSPRTAPAPRDIASAKRERRKTWRCATCAFQTANPVEWERHMVTALGGAEDVADLPEAQRLYVERPGAEPVKQPATRRSVRRRVA
jgi:hypothetical protein